MSSVDFPELEATARVTGGRLRWDTDTAAAGLVLGALGVLVLVKQFIR